MKELSLQELKDKSYQLREIMFETCVRAKTGHVTSSLSCVEIMVALYHGGILNFDSKNPDWNERDRFILSKGQASPILYTLLADLDYYSTTELERFAQKDGIFGVHLQNDVPGVEITSGSLGHGFGVAAGIALAAKMNKESHMVFSLLGDGECYEGSIWEAAMFASHNKLNNLVAIVDRNKLCVTDFTEDLLKLESFEEKWSAFGWNVKRIDGHSFEQIFEALKNCKNAEKDDRPLVVIADTVKGKGIDYIANQPLWHGIAPEGDDVEKARTSLKKREE